MLNAVWAKVKNQAIEIFMPSPIFEEDLRLPMVIARTDTLKSEANDGYPYGSGDLCLSKPVPNEGCGLIDFVNTSQNFTAFWLFRYRTSIKS